MAILRKAYLGSTPLFVEKDWFEDNSPFVTDVAEATVTASATPHTKGSWVEVIASTSSDTSLLTVAVTGIQTSTVNTASLLDIGTGGSGSETAILSNVAVGGAFQTSFATPACLAFEVPFKIPSGTRIAARLQSLVASKTGVVRVGVCNAGDYATAPTAVDVIGTNTATSTAIALTGVTTYAEVIASTSQAYRAIVVVPSLATATAATVSDVMTVAIGAASSEVDFAAVPFRRTSTEQIANLPPFVSLFGRNIPAGSRLSVKGVASGSGVECTLIGIP